MGLDPIVWYVVFVLSVTAHEAGHAAVAYLGGDPTAYLGGQVSLNPVPHMRREPFGMVVVPLVSALAQGFPIGWASAPYDPRWEQRHPQRAAWMAAAGPGANLALLLLAFAALRLGLGLEIFSIPDEIRASQLVAAAGPLLDGLGRFLSMLLAMNLLLALFNLFPVPPLDGLSVLGLLLPGNLGLRIKASLRHPALAIGGLVALWMLLPRIFPPLFWRVAALIYGPPG